MQPQELGRSNPTNAAKSELGVDLARASGSASVVQAKGEVSGDRWNLRGQVDALYAEGSAGLRLTENGYVADAGVGVGLIHASGSAAASNGIVSAEAKADAFAGAEARGRVNIGPAGSGVSGEAFAGARVRGEVGGDIGGIGGRVRAEAWAGAGIGAEYKYGFEDGRVTFSAGAGAALGSGGKVGFEVSVNVNEVFDNVSKAANAVDDFLSEIEL